MVWSQHDESDHSLLDHFVSPACMTLVKLLLYCSAATALVDKMPHGFINIQCKVVWGKSRPLLACSDSLATDIDVHYLGVGNACCVCHAQEHIPWDESSSGAVSMSFTGGSRVNPWVPYLNLRDVLALGLFF
ncbi:hypothetical protein ElyMa_005223100 [Elysia marginata]|uniref:Uncharacterized protein n=1 Tax=Elysia marginata TaxID=1093978 RepID=A0AAV4JV90_9GAST|nr:hypothetical protein ElyMa_005223100 [Elysia marginata]